MHGAIGSEVVFWSGWARAPPAPCPEVFESKRGIRSLACGDEACAFVADGRVYVLRFAPPDPSPRLVEGRGWSHWCGNESV